MGSPVSFENAISKYVPYHPVSAEILAQKLGMKAPVSVRNMVGQLNGMPTTMSFSQQWSTPDGTPLGGAVTLNVNSDGTYTVDFKATTRSRVPGLSFDFQVRAYLSAPAIPHCLFFYHAGSVGANLTSDGVDDHVESGSNPLIQMYWSQIVNSATKFSVGKDYKWGGVVGALVNLVDDLIDIVAAAAGTAIGAVIALTREAISWLGITLGPGGTIGVISGVVVFAVGAIAGLGVGSALILGIVAGVAVGAVANSMIQSRSMLPLEITTAQKVFGTKIPYDNVMFTNLSGLNNRAFTAPGVDGKTYCNLGDAFSNPLGAGKGAYPAPAELMIHELTHAWQIGHNSFLPGFVCSGIVNQATNQFGDDVYAYGPAGPDWSSLNLEQQGAIVNGWFAGNLDKYTRQTPYEPTDTVENPYYRYISGNILTGSAGFSTAWL